MVMKRFGLGSADDENDDQASIGSTADSSFLSAGNSPTQDLQRSNLSGGVLGKSDVVSRYASGPLKSPTSDRLDGSGSSLSGNNAANMDSRGLQSSPSETQSGYSVSPQSSMTAVGSMSSAQLATSSLEKSRSRFDSKLERVASAHRDELLNQAVMGSQSSGKDAEKDSEVSL